MTVFRNSSAPRVVWKRALVVTPDNSLNPSTTVSSIPTFSFDVPDVELSNLNHLSNLQPHPHPCLPTVASSVDSVKSPTSTTKPTTKTLATRAHREPLVRHFGLLELCRTRLEVSELRTDLLSYAYLRTIRLTLLAFDLCLLRQAVRADPAVRTPPAADLVFRPHFDLRHTTLQAPLTTRLTTRIRTTRRPRTLVRPPAAVGAAVAVAEVLRSPNPRTAGTPKSIANANATTATTLASSTSSANTTRRSTPRNRTSSTAPIAASFAVSSSTARPTSSPTSASTRPTDRASSSPRPTSPANRRTGSAATSKNFSMAVKSKNLLLPGLCSNAN